MTDNTDYPAFRPHRLLRHAHAQTVCSLYYPYEQPEYRAVLHEVSLEDGDRLAIHDDRPDDWQPGDRCALMLHGLGGCYKSGHISRIAEKLVRRGIRSFRMDQRGCGAGALLAKGHTHAGRSEDLHAGVQEVRKHCPGSPITLVGFSMGANILLKLLAEYGTSHDKEVDSAFVVAPPIDLILCSDNIRRGFNRMYDRSFVKRLHRLAHLRRKEVDGYLDRDLGELPKRIFEFDDVYTAPLAGFDGAKDYYRRCSTFSLIKQIDVPTRLLVAKDDPLIPISMFSNNRLSNAVDLHVSRKGGHIGYLGIKGVDPDRWWLDWRVVDFVAQQPGRVCA